MDSYHKRLLRELTDSVESARRMLERDTNDSSTEFLSRLPAIRTQCAQAAHAASELYGALSQQRFGGR